MSGEGEPVLDAIVLAAGAGSRFGGRKLLAPLGDGTVLSASLRVALSRPVRNAVVVLGAEAGLVGAEAGRAADALGARDRVRLTTAADWGSGMSASIRTALLALDQDAEAAFVFLGDMPRVPPSLLPALAEALRQGADAACPVVEGRRGHPALIRRSLFASLQALRGDQGARSVLATLGSGLALVPTDDAGVLQDVDTPADLAALAVA